MIDYDPHHWLRHLLDVRGSMLREIFLRVMSCCLFAAAVVYVHLRVHPVDISDKPHAFIGTALGLLLVFRTNASYDRYWEGRKLWGTIVNVSRNLARRAVALLAAEPATVDQLLRWTIAFPYITMHSLRGEKSLDQAAALLTPEQVRRTLAAQHGPSAVAAELSTLLAQAFRRGVISDVTHAKLEADVGILVDSLGGCERIIKTPLPFPYVVHLRRALVMYCFTLPFALVSSFGWLAIVATTMLAYTLFGIEEIGVEIENPFEKEENDLPLARICQTIEDNLRALLSKDAAPRPDHG